MLWSQDIRHLLTLDQRKRELRDAAIFVKGPEVIWVGETKDLPTELGEADEVLSLAEHVVIPGLVNTHHHTFQNLTRCIAQVRQGLLCRAEASIIDQPSSRDDVSA